VEQSVDIAALGEIKKYGLFNYSLYLGQGVSKL
jgi:hypothetical protein